MLKKIECKEFISTVARHSGEQSSNVFMACVVDCAIVKGKLVIYEIQSLANSQISKNAFLRCIDSFEQGVFIKQGMLKQSVIQSESGTFHLSEFLPNHDKFLENNGYYIPDNINLDSTTKKTLIVYDYLYDKRDHIINQHYDSKKYHKNKNIYWMNADVTDPIEAVFKFKHFQRLLMSDITLTPSFVFIENKFMYTKADIDAIKNALQLNDTDNVVIKKNSATKGEGNVFLKLKYLLSYMNENEFKEKYANDSVILIEEVKNELHQGKYQTHRYAASYLSEENFICIDAYKEEHVKLDSHENPNITWLDNTISDVDTNTKIKELLNTIRVIDYSDLILKLLSSKNTVKILLGIEILYLTVELLYIRRSNEDSKIISINFPQEMLDLFKSFKKSSNINIRNGITKVIENIFDFVKHIPEENIEGNIMETLVVNANDNIVEANFERFKFFKEATSRNSFLKDERTTPSPMQKEMIAQMLNDTHQEKEAINEITDLTMLKNNLDPNDVQFEKFKFVIDEIARKYNESSSGKRGNSRNH